MIRIAMTSELSWQRNDPITYYLGIAQIEESSSLVLIWQ